MCSNPLPGIRDQIVTRPSLHPSQLGSSINDIEDASGRTRTATINGACFRYFTMQPKVGIVTYSYLNAKRLAKHGTLTHLFSQQSRRQTSPPGLPFTGVVRFSVYVDVIIRFTPRATEQEIYTPQGRNIWPTDLFFLCERMPDAESAACGPNVPAMYVSYLPLAGKHLRACDVADPRECTISAAAFGTTSRCCSQDTSRSSS